MSARVEIHSGDITALEVDAIVNAANDRLAPGGARITEGYELRARHVIHAVGPVWQGGTEGEDGLLASAYRSSLDLAKRQGLASIAFPAISTGVYGYPLEHATEIAVRTVCDWLDKAAGIERVVFCVFGEAAEAAYREAMARRA